MMKNKMIHISNVDKQTILTDTPSHYLIQNSKYDVNNCAYFTRNQKLILSHKYTLSVLSLLIGCIAPAWADDNPMPTAENSGFNYKYSSQDTPNPYLHYDEETGQTSFVDPTGTLTDHVFDESFFASQDSNNTYSSIAGADVAPVVKLYEGNNVSGGGIILNTQGENAYSVLYNNYAVGVELNNSDGGTVYVNHNNANQAKVTNTGSKSYILIEDSSAQDATLINNEGSMVLNGNLANGAAITNNNGAVTAVNNSVQDATLINNQGSMIFKNNLANGATITNNNGTVAALQNSVQNANLTNTGESAKFFAYGNDITGAQVENGEGATLIVGDCTLALGCTEEKGTTAKDVMINNAGKFYLSGNFNITNGQINNNGELFINNVTINDGILNNVQNGQVTLSGRNQITSQVNNNGGVSITDGRTDFIGSITGSGIINIAENSIINLMSDSSTFSGNIYNDGILSVKSDAEIGGTIYVNSTGVVIGTGTVGSINAANGSTIYSGNYQQGGALTVDGDFIGDNANVVLDTIMLDQASDDNVFTITGHASGTSYVTARYLGGQPQLDKIKVISTGSSDEDAFVQGGRIVGGAYDYRLEQSDADWYLAKSTFRPEVGGYVANMIASNTLFNLNQQDYIGTDQLTRQNNHGMWLRQQAGYRQFNLSDNQNQVNASRYVVQLGGDVISGSTDQWDKYQFGLMAGYANQHAKTDNRVSHYQSKSHITGYSVGIYGGWQQDASQLVGLYTAGYLQYNWFNNQVDTDSGAERYKSHGFNVSFEGGYRAKLGSYQTLAGLQNQIYLQPEAQISWLGVKTDAHQERNLTQVSGEGKNNIQTRLGVRLFIDSQSYLDLNDQRHFQPYVAFSWIHNSRQYGVTMNDASIYQQGSKDLAELKVGLDVKMSTALSMWGNVAHQQGQHSNRDTQATLGIRYTF